MTIAKLLKGTALSAVVAAMAVTALPASAQRMGGERAEAQQRGGDRWQQRGGERQRSEGQRTQNREQRGDGQRAQVREQRSDGNRAAAQAAVRTRTEANVQRVERNRGDQARDWQQQRQSPPVTANAGQPDRRGDWRGRDDNRSRDTERNRTYRGDDRNSGSRQDWRDGRNDGRSDGRQADRRDDRNNYRDGYRDGRQADRRDNRSNYRDGYRDGRQAGYQDNRRWDRSWRDNNRYNWSHYRNQNRNIFRIGRYYSPYSGYSYRRLSIGFTLSNLFYSNRYWINDPWQYRLPAVYGPYRWVRYYDDVLLVNTYTGEVVDVIHDFFW